MGAELGRKDKDIVDCNQQLRGHSQSIYAKKKEVEPTLLDQFEAKAVLNTSGLGRTFLA